MKEKEFRDVELLKNDLNNQKKDRYSQVGVISEYLLKHLGAKNEKNTKSTTEILHEYDLLKENFSNDIPRIPHNTFGVMLSKIAQEQNSKINCLGRKQGYYIEQLVQKLEKIEEEAEKQKEVDIEHQKEVKFQEKDLYHILKEWLFEKDIDRVADISNMKSNGKWGNPDLVGLKIEDVYSRPDIEITTIEVKLTEENWEQWIFEAISHTRFANRSYFSFLYPENLINKLNSTGIKLYAEHFGIGILVIGIKNEDYLKIKERKPVTIDPEDLRIIEYQYAPYTQTNIKFRKNFLTALDILELNKLYKFGEELE